MSSLLHLALYEPEIPQNVGAAVRLAAGLGCDLDLIEPFGFVFNLRKVRRTSLDYHERARISRHPSWHSFDAWRRASGRRLVVLTTGASVPYTDVAYATGDVLLGGRESSGLPEAVHEAADLRVVIPLMAGVRSLNVTTALAMVAGEARRQLTLGGVRSEVGE